MGFETRPEDFRISLKKKGQRITNLGGRELQTLGLEKKQLGNRFMKKDWFVIINWLSSAKYIFCTNKAQIFDVFFWCCLFHSDDDDSDVEIISVKRPKEDISSSQSCESTFVHEYFLFLFFFFAAFFKYRVISTYLAIY